MIPKMKPATTLDELERNVAAIEEFERVKVYVSGIRRRILGNPLPRAQCPGCFSHIYEGAAAQGWCCDCWPNRLRYAAMESGSAKEER